MFIFPIVTILLLVYFIGLGTFVYIDAPKHGMQKWLWILVVTLVPNFLGLVVYLIIRSINEKETCINCGKTIEKDYNICPYCKHNRQLTCENCGQKVKEDWKVCPQCSNELSKGGLMKNEEK